MTRFLLVLLLAVPAHSFSQAIPFGPAPPVASLTATAVYLGLYEPTNHSRSLWGWSASPDVSLNRQLSIEGEVSNLYMRSVYPGESRLILAAGPRYQFPYFQRYRTALFVFAQGGKVQASRPFATHNFWDPLIEIGFGFEHPLSRHFSLTLVPGEYLGEHLPDGTWDDSFAAHAGFTFKFYRWRPSS